MGVLTRRKLSQLNKSNGSSEKEAPLPAEAETSSNGSVEDENNDKIQSGTTVSATQNKGKSLRDRSKIPNSAYLCGTLLISLQFFSGLYDLSVLKGWFSSMETSAMTTFQKTIYLKQLFMTLIEGNYRPWQEYAAATVSAATVFSLIYVFFIAPFRAGFWTGHRSRKQLIHRYMGLFYLVQYSFAWVEILTNYKDGAATSYIPHLLAMNGMTQAWSAYFQFKVLPELDDAGYYSDKAVLSRNFVHENIFFQMMTFFGSVYYNEPHRQMLRSTIPGRIVEYIFVFWPYVAIRTWFPITRFSIAGTTHKGRTDKNLKFYEIGTLMVKIFFLWAKYFLGFYMNFMVFLELIEEKSMPFFHGMFLLNLGTVSLAVFLHTLRFKKVLPPRLTFSLYLVQIYATFSAIPFAYEMFVPHPKLCGVALAGLLANMTRSRKIHAAWCFATMCLLSYDGIEW